MSRPRLVRLSFLSATQIFMLYFSRFGSNCCWNSARPKKRWDVAKQPNAAPQRVQERAQIGIRRDRLKPLG
jgi:hypothetical protein